VIFDLAIRARSDRPDVRVHSAGAQIFEETVLFTGDQIPPLRWGRLTLTQSTECKLLRMNAVRPHWRIPGIVARERRHPPGRQRIPEPMVMNDPESVREFHSGGASNYGMQAVYDFGARALDALLPSGGRLLDLGVGSGHALSAVLRRRPDVEAAAVDLAPNMLSTARRLFSDQGVDGRVELVKADITDLPERLATDDWDAVSCMWTLHQLPDIGKLRAALQQIATIHRNSIAAVWISDFQRLRDPSALAALLDCVDPSTPAVLRSYARMQSPARRLRSPVTSWLRNWQLLGWVECNPVTRDPCGICRCTGAPQTAERQLV
jgi:tRNA (cmo5U34)-methyltransferase